jgi:hypothetical protein
MYKKLGNTFFHKDAGKTMTFETFKKTYSGVLTGISFEEAYTSVGGVIEDPETVEKKPSKKGKKKD